MDMVSGEGLLNYSITETGLYRLVVDVDPAISDYYRALVPKSVRLNRQKYAPHITVLREAAIPRLLAWGAYDGERIVFEYNPEIRTGEVYFWLEVYSKDLEDIRVGLGLDPFGPNARPPDDKDCFHMTLGNLK